MLWRGAFAAHPLHIIHVHVRWQNELWTGAANLACTSVGFLDGDQVKAHAFRVHAVILRNCN